MKLVATNNQQTQNEIKSETNYKITYITPKQDKEYSYEDVLNEINIERKEKIYAWNDINEIVEKLRKEPFKGWKNKRMEFNKNCGKLLDALMIYELEEIDNNMSEEEKNHEKALNKINERRKIKIHGWYDIKDILDVIAKEPLTIDDIDIIKAEMNGTVLYEALRKHSKQTELITMREELKELREEVAKLNEVVCAMSEAVYND